MSIEAMKMALKALEAHADIGIKSDKAVTALRQAIEQAEMIDKGTKAWADVPNATDWVEELRGGAEKPWVKTYCGGKPNYCTPVDAVNMKQECVDETAKDRHEPVAYKEECWACGCEECVCAKRALGSFSPPKKEWVGLTDEEREQFRKLGFVGVLAVENKLREKNG